MWVPEHFFGRVTFEHFWGCFERSTLCVCLNIQGLWDPRCRNASSGATSGALRFLFNEFGVFQNCTNGTSCSSCILTNRLSFLTTMQGFIFYIKRYLYPQYYIFPLKGTVSRDFYQTIFSAKLTYFGFWLTLLKVFSNTAWISRKYSYRQSKKSLNNQCLEWGILVLLLKYSPSI